MHCHTCLSKFRMPFRWKQNFGKAGGGDSKGSPAQAGGSPALRGRGVGVGGGAGLGRNALTDSLPLPNANSTQGYENGEQRFEFGKKPFSHESH